MTRSDSQTTSDQVAQPETQDSQAIYEALREELGVIPLSGDTPKSVHTDEQPPDAHSLPATVNEVGKSTGSIIGSRLTDSQPQVPVFQQTYNPGIDIDSNLETVKTQYDTHARGVEVPRSLDSPNHQSPVEPRVGSALSTLHNARLPTLKQDDAVVGKLPTRKMDGSQQTPTQVNEDRDYEVCDSIPSSLDREPSGPTLEANEERTFRDDDTGAVNFANLSQWPRPSSQVSEDGGFQKTTGVWGRAEDTSQQQSNHAFTPFKQQQDTEFETPALPKNPFGANPGGAAPLAGTQLFGQTQFSSVAKLPKFTPTSSRPSPMILNHSFSPNVAETSPLKDRTNVSSPTDLRTSSPNRLDEVPATVCRVKRLPRVEEETPSAGRSVREDRIPGSPTNPRPRSSESHQPLAHYESVKKSQERKHTDDSIYRFVGSDSEDDETLRQHDRRKRAEKKKAQAAREMEKVFRIPNPLENSHERPAAKRRRTDSNEEPQKATQTQRPQTTGQTNSSNEQALIADSQKRDASPGPFPVKGSTERTDDATEDAQDEATAGTQPMVISSGAPGGLSQMQAPPDERIPATSPMPTPASGHEEEPQPQSEPDIPMNRNGDESPRPPNELGSSSLPAARHRGQSTYGRKTRAPPRNVVMSSSPSEVTPHKPDVSTDEVCAPSSSPASTTVTDGTKDQQPKAGAAEALGPVVDHDATPQQKSPAKASCQMTTRSRKRQQPKATTTTPSGKRRQQPPRTSSGSGSLSSAPPSSAISTPFKGDTSSPEREGSISLPPPGEQRGLRNRTALESAHSVSPRSGVRHSRRAKTHVPRYGSESTNEPDPTPPGSVVERSGVHPKSSRAFRQSWYPASRAGGRLFEGMVFAISFQSSSAKSQDRTKLEKKIQQAGGHVLLEGFEELFENSSFAQTAGPVFDQDGPMILSPQYAKTGFTALIVDSHSRKAKYMQALALGLPCLAHQWITTCLRRGSIVDWEPYLLSSGASAVLGDALRSRYLPPYAAADARLSEMVDQRQKLLEGQRVLFVMDSKKSRSEAKQPYIFLARALGPSISRVFTSEEAREALAKHAHADGINRPFDWIYVDQGTGSVESILRGPTIGGGGGGGGRKRKKRGGAAASASTSASASASHFNNVRVLNDELVIQSLILGRMVLDDEINF